MPASGSNSSFCEPPPLVSQAMDCPLRRATSASRQSRAAYSVSRPHGADYEDGSGRFNKIEVGIRLVNGNGGKPETFIEGSGMHVHTGTVYHDPAGPWGKPVPDSTFIFSVRAG